MIHTRSRPIHLVRAGMLVGVLFFLVPAHAQDRPAHWPAKPAPPQRDVDRSSYGMGSTASPAASWPSYAEDTQWNSPSAGLKDEQVALLRKKIKLLEDKVTQLEKTCPPPKSTKK
jgi:hypothetical protein